MLGENCWQTPSVWTLFSIKQKYCFATLARDIFKQWISDATHRTKQKMNKINNSELERT